MRSAPRHSDARLNESSGPRFSRSPVASSPVAIACLPFSQLLSAVLSTQARGAGLDASSSPRTLGGLWFPNGTSFFLPHSMRKDPRGVAALGAVREASGEELTDVSEDEELRVGRISLGQEGEEGGRGSRSV